jgi:valyl-tRNA synthetase
MKNELVLHYGENNTGKYFVEIIKKLVNINNIEALKESQTSLLSFRVATDEFFVPLPEDSVDIEAELVKLNEELKYTKGFLNSVMKKLSNKGFVSNAPTKVVEIENKKKEDAEAKINLLEQQIEQLKK